MPPYSYDATHLSVRPCRLCMVSDVADSEQLVSQVSTIRSNDDAIPVPGEARVGTDPVTRLKRRKRI